jgi:2-methylcitrate dehydratase PrpD
MKIFQPARETAIRAITDTIGVTTAGTQAESTAIVNEFVTGTAISSGLPDPRETETEAEVADLALVYGTAGHALDYDDLSWAMDGHPSVVLLPPILALANRSDPTGKEVITAYAAGFETACYVAAPISPGHYESGWHATATFGTIGATAVTASLLDLDAKTTTRALHIAASMPAGTKQNFGSMTKPLHAGLAAQSGVTAGFLAAKGFTAGDQTLDGPHGFWRLYGPETDDFEMPNPPTSDGWLLEHRGIHIKRYPACYFTHSAIAATQSLVNNHDLTPKEIEYIDVTAADGAGDALSYERPTDALESKFSMQHAVAVALVADHVSLDEFTNETVKNQQYTDLYPKISFSTDESLAYDSHAATVTIETNTNTYRTIRENPPWTHKHPPTSDELETKFIETTRVASADDAKRIFEAFQSLPSQQFLDMITPLIGHC